MLTQAPPGNYSAVSLNITGLSDAAKHFFCAKLVFLQKIQAFAVCHKVIASGTRLKQVQQAKKQVG